MGTQPRYPQVHVKLVGEDGNAFAILCRVRKAMKDAKVPSAEIAAFTKEATSGDYGYLLRTVMEWVSTDGPQEVQDELEWEGDDATSPAIQFEREH